MDMCEVQYHEGTVSGQFQESVEIDRVNGIYEKLQVPPVLDSRRSTIVHDFEKVDLLLLFNSACVTIFASKGPSIKYVHSDGWGVDLRDGICAVFATGRG